MPIYCVVHKESGEKKELYLNMSEYIKWCEDNPDWKKDWSVSRFGIQKYQQHYKSNR